jgi:hypothetical protein
MIYGKDTNSHAHEPATYADLRALKDSVTALATQAAVSAVMETAAETKEGVTELKGHMRDMMEDLTATHEAVRYLWRSVDMLVRDDAAQDVAMKTLTAQVTHLEKKVGLTR